MYKLIKILSTIAITTLLIFHSFGEVEASNVAVDYNKCPYGQSSFYLNEYLGDIYYCVSNIYHYDVIKNYQGEKIILDKEGKLVRNSWYEIMGNRGIERYYAPESGFAYFDGFGIVPDDNGKEDLYYFNILGIMQSNFMLKDGDFRFYFKEDGKAARSEFVEHGGRLYYAERGGVILNKEGWNTIDGYDYYISRDNYIKQETIIYDEDKVYYVLSDGKKAINEHIKSPFSNSYRYYYAKEDGQLATGFTNIEDNTYYFDLDNFQRYVGIYNLNNETYYFDHNGILVKNRLIETRHGYSYYDSEGKQVQGWKKIDGHRYYFTPIGSYSNGAHLIKTKDSFLEYYFDSDSRLIENGWYQDKSGFIYINNHGLRQDYFTDVKELNSFYYYINDLVKDNIISGYAVDNTFRPNNNLTRAQAAKMIVESAGINTKGVKSNFKDVKKGTSQYTYISALVEAGVVDGYSDGTFRPNAPVTRAQIAKMVTLAFDLDLKGNPNKFVDVESLSSANTREYIYILSSNDIVKGYGNEFRPRNNVTRGQFSKIVSIARNPEKYQD